MKTKRFNTKAEQVEADKKLRADFAALNAKLYADIAALLKRPIPVGHGKTSIPLVTK